MPIALSVGSEPTRSVNPAAIAGAIGPESQIDIAHEWPKPWTDEIIPRRRRIVVTMGCGDACVLPGQALRGLGARGSHAGQKTLRPMRPILRRDRTAGAAAPRIARCRGAILPWRRSTSKAGDEPREQVRFPGCSCDPRCRRSRCGPWPPSAMRSYTAERGTASGRQLVPDRRQRACCVVTVPGSHARAPRRRCAKSRIRALGGVHAPASIRIDLHRRSPRQLAASG